GEFGTDLCVYLVCVEQLDLAVLDVVNATAQLIAPSRIDLALLALLFLGIEGLQTAMNQRGAVAPIEREERLLDFRKTHGHMLSLRCSPATQSGNVPPGRR